MNIITDLNNSAVTALLQKSPIYQKQATVTAVQVERTQQVTTVVRGNYIETENTAYPGDWIITNPGNEQYILPNEIFNQRYRATSQPGLYQAVGEIRAVKNPYLTEITIIAPWGKEQHGNADCYIAALFDNDGNISKHRYLIEYDAFHQTYIEKID